MAADLAALREKGWFPAAATAMADAAGAVDASGGGAGDSERTSPLPPGFTAHEVSLPWTTLTMLLPPTGIGDPVWWHSLADATDSWGDVAALASVRVVRLAEGRLGPVAHLDCGRYGLWMAEIVPFDADGHGRRLSDFSDDRCHGAKGGVQWRGRDVLLLRRDLSELPTAAEALRSVLVAGESTLALALVRNAGGLLGRFHMRAAKVVRIPRDAGRWNDRLKRIEEVTHAKTLWRAPHAAETESTITHRSFSLECVLLLRDAAGEPDSSRGRLLLPAPGLADSLLPLDARMPALRDVAAGYRSIEVARRAAEAEPDCAPLPPQGELRREFLDAWAAKAPRAWSSDAALDSHRGGLPVWEYEQTLVELLLARATGEEPTESTLWFLDHVDRIQARMFRSRTFAAAALTALCCSGFGVYAWLTGMLLVMQALPLMMVGLLHPPLRRLYRRAAPPPA